MHWTCSAERWKILSFSVGGQFILYIKWVHSVGQGLKGQMGKEGLVQVAQWYYLTLIFNLSDLALLLCLHKI